MSEYRRFVAYIYEYTNGKKNKNTGFAKVESRNGICRMQVHLQKVPQEKEALNIYGFVREGGWLLGISLGKICIQGACGDARIQTPSQNIGGSAYALRQIAGIWIEGSQGQKYLTVFDDEGIDTGRLVTSLPGKAEVEEVQPIGGQTDSRETEQRDKEAIEQIENWRKNQVKEQEKELKEYRAGEKERQAPGESIQETENRETAEEFLVEAESEEILEEPVAEAESEEVLEESIAETETEELSEKVETEEVPEEVSEGRDGESEPEILTEGLEQKEEPEKGKTSGNLVFGEETPEQFEAEGEPEVSEQEIHKESPRHVHAQEAALRLEEDMGIPQQAHAANGGVRPVSPSGGGSRPPQLQGLDRKWQCMGGRCPHFQPFADDEVADCIQITPRELRVIQQGNFRAGNNSFLMHGFCHYRHLLFGKCRDGGYILGIPGVFESQEQYMANMFGFPIFKEAVSQNQGGRFGYWCRRLP